MMMLPWKHLKRQRHDAAYQQQAGNLRGVSILFRSQPMQNARSDKSEHKYAPNKDGINPRIYDVCHTSVSEDIIAFSQEWVE